MYDCPANRHVAFQPGAMADKWEQAVKAGTEWDFWRENADGVIRFLREAQTALDQGDWS